ncbi:dTDP-4-dehydrorhamnose reductase [Mariniflexile soesokkakense]|uniref:dTDP-4-dehydrorhamnose reductase n=1 Tax=Mariniflexile soesokkakense TaxID=1343160 RepID=A0ABV0A9M9_9FLAO
MIKILVTGSLGQLGRCIQDITDQYPDFEYKFVDVDELDICNKEQVQLFFDNYKPDFCINTAAYTAVDKAEEDSRKAFDVNANGAKNLAESCLMHNTVLIHISTDFVFDGTKTIPYNETDLPNPISVYGASKLQGERYIEAILQKHIIIRTSWLYSPFGSNFVKTMLRLAETKSVLNVINDQIGTPTNAYDLAGGIMQVIVKHVQLEKNSEAIQFYGTYHFSNEGACSWYDFAKKIFDINKINIDLRPIPTSGYPTPAKRPMYSVLDKTKFKRTFDFSINNWDKLTFKSKN